MLGDATTYYYVIKKRPPPLEFAFLLVPGSLSKDEGFTWNGLFTLTKVAISCCMYRNEVRSLNFPSIANKFHTCNNNGKRDASLSTNGGDPTKSTFQIAVYSSIVRLSARPSTTERSHAVLLREAHQTTISVFPLSRTGGEGPWVLYAYLNVGTYSDECIMISNVLKVKEHLIDPSFVGGFRNDCWRLRG
jgi:hypothetical protein